MTAGARVTPDGVTSYRFDDGLVLLDGRASRLFAYNASAAAVWHARTSGADAAQALHDAYGISRAQAAHDASAIVEDWRSLGLVSGGPGGVHDSAAAADAAPPPSSKHRGTALHAVYSIGGRAFRIAVSDDAVAGRVEALFRSFRVDSDAADETIEVHRPADGRTLVLSRDGIEILHVDSVAEVTGALFQQVLGGIYSGGRWLAIIHGGAVSSNGRAVLLPGASGNGKSTLGAFLYSRGFDYLCDDMLAVTDDGGVASWPIPISIKEGSWEALAPYLPELDAIPREFVWGRTMKILPVAAESWRPHIHRASVLIFPRFDRLTGSARTIALRPLTTLQRLISDRIWLGHPLCTTWVERFLHWLARVPSYELSYSRFDQVESLVRETLGRD